MKMPIVLAPGAVCMLVLAPSQTYAQEASSVGAAESGSFAADDELGNTILVTARRREEDIQSVPVAVSAFNAEFLEDRGVRDSADLSRAVPSLYIDQGGFSSSSSNIALRGITNPGSNISFDPTIGIYIDEVYLARNYGSLFDYFDIASVQVLRGVQGTLFGRNNLGGAILISTQKPQPENAMEFELGIGNYDAFRASAVINVEPIEGLLALRGGFLTTTRDGWGLDVNSGRDLADKDSQTARFSALLTPQAGGEFQLTYERSWRDQTGPIFKPREPVGRPIPPGLGFYEVAYDSPVGDEGVDQYLTGRASVELGNVDIKLIGNWLKGDETIEQDVDGTDVFPNIHFVRRTLHEQHSAELQFSGAALADRLQWLVGGYYLKETGFQPTTNVEFLSQTILHIDNSTRAAFGHLDFDIAPGLQIGGGVRYTKDKKGEDYGTISLATGNCTTSAAVQVPGAYDPSTCLVSVQKNDGYVSWDANVNYEVTPDILAYARVGRGQKSGGFNSGLANAADLLGYRPEIATDYEIGLKTTLLDGAARFNLAAFQTDYKDVQRTRLVLVGTPPNQSTVLSVSNAAKARIRGLEAELSADLADGLSVNANYSYTDPKYLEFTSLDANGDIVDQTNFPFAYVSRHQFGGDISYEVDIPSVGELEFGVNYSYRSSYNATVIPDPLFIQDGYGVLGAQARFRPDALPNFEAKAWISNITDEEWFTHGASGGGGSIRFVGPGQPRLYGLTLLYRFEP